MKREVNMLSGSIVKGLLTIALPIMVMNVVQSLFNIIDMTILKSYDAGGGSAVGAIGACGTLISLITGLLIGCSTGVAFATIISWTFSAVLGVCALIRNKGVLKLKVNRIRFYKYEIEKILKIGVPAGLQQALYSVANVIITATVNSFGPEATTGISIANNFDGILYQISVATSLAVMPYVSQNVGKGNIKRATQAVTRGIGITVCLGLTFGMLSAIFSAELSSIMSSDPVVIAYSQQKMIIISSTYFICGINEIMGAALRGMGRPTIATISTLIFMCVLRFVWVYLVFPHFRNLTFLYLVWPIGWVLSIITLLFFYVPTVRKLKMCS